MIRHLRLVMPRGWILGLFAFMYLMLEGILLLIETWDPSLIDITNFRNNLVLIACLLYGIHRVLSFHPVFQTPYRKWLELTPWTSRLPLPVGPIHLVWQDFVVLLGAEVLLQGDVKTLWVEPARLLLAGYLVFCLVALSGTSQRVIAYALAFGLGLVTRLWTTPVGAYPQPIPSLVAELTLYGLAYAGIRRSLATFPWELAFWEKAKTASAWNQPVFGETTSQAEWVGWPFNRLQPKLPSMMIRYSDGSLVSLLAGWWLYAVVSLVESESDRAEMFEIFYSMITGAAVIGRFLIYRAGHAAPIGFWGRVLTLRWIIPRHDQIYLVPFCAVLVAIAALYWVKKLEMPSDICGPISLTLTLIVILNMGPSLARWRFAGACRLTPGLQSSVYSKL